MRFYKIVLIFLIIFSSCKSSKTTFSAVAIAEKMSAKKVTRKHISTNFTKKTIEAKLKVNYKDNRSKQNVSVKLRIEKDRVIWLNVSATALGINVARIKITPTQVSYYEKVNKTYFDGDFMLLKSVLGTDVNFYQLQNLLLGQTIFDLKSQKYTSSVNNNAHLLLPEHQNILFDVLFWVNPAHFKLDKQELKNSQKNQTLEIAYKSYSLVDGEIFPKEIVINGKENEKFTNITIAYKNVVFNKKFSTSYQVPKGYKQVAF